MSFAANLPSYGRPSRGDPFCIVPFALRNESDFFFHIDSYSRLIVPPLCQDWHENTRSIAERV
jgi:hypothetical protein